MLFVSNILVFSIFLYAACLFYLKMHHLASYSFKRSVKFSYILVLGNDDHTLHRCFDARYFLLNITNKPRLLEKNQEFRPEHSRRQRV